MLLLVVWSIVVVEVVRSCPVNLTNVSSSACVMSEAFAGPWDVSFDDETVRGHDVATTLNENVTSMSVHGGNNTIAQFLIRDAYVPIEGDGNRFRTMLFFNSTINVTGKNTSFLDSTFVGSTLVLEHPLTIESVVLIQSSVAPESAILISSDGENFVLGKSRNDTIQCRNETDPCLVFRNRADVGTYVVDPRLETLVLLDANCTFEASDRTCQDCGESGWGRDGDLDQCSPCVAGTRARNNTCEQCEAGTLSNETANTVCHECLAGRVQPLRGMSFCDPCSELTEVAVNRTDCEQCPTGSWTQDSIACRECLCVDPYTDHVEYIEHDGFCESESNCGVYCDPATQHFALQGVEYDGVESSILCGICNGTHWRNPATNELNGTCDSTFHDYVTMLEVNRGVYCSKRDQYWHEIKENVTRSEMCGTCVGLQWAGYDEPQDFNVNANDTVCRATCNATTHLWSEYSEYACGLCLEDQWVPPPITGTDQVTCNATSHYWREYPEIRCGTCNGTHWTEPPADETIRVDGVANVTCSSWMGEECHEDYESGRVHPFTLFAATFEELSPSLGTWYECNVTDQHWWDHSSNEHASPRNTSLPCGACTNGTWVWVDETGVVLAVNHTTLCLGVPHKEYSYPGENTNTSGEVWAPPLVCQDGSLKEFTPRIAGENVSLETWWDRELEWRDDAGFPTQWSSQYDWVTGPAVSASANQCTVQRDCRAWDVFCEGWFVPCYLLPGSDPYKVIEWKETQDASCPAGWKPSVGTQWTCSEAGDLLDEQGSVPTCVLDEENDCRLPNQVVFPMECDGQTFYRGSNHHTTVGTNCTANCQEGWMGCPIPCENGWEEWCWEPILIHWNRTGSCNIPIPSELVKCMVMVQDATQCVARVVIQNEERPVNWEEYNVSVVAKAQPPTNVVRQTTSTFIWVVGYIIAAAEIYLWWFALFTPRSDRIRISKTVTSAVLLVLIVWIASGLAIVAQMDTTQDSQTAAMIAVGLPLYGILAFLMRLQKSGAAMWSVPIVLGLVHLFGFAVVQAEAKRKDGGLRTSSVPLILAALGFGTTGMVAVCLMFVQNQTSVSGPPVAKSQEVVSTRIRMSNLHRRTMTKHQ